eukprot:jgi/Ulvmu1/1396/UM011_0124.1
MWSTEVHECRLEQALQESVAVQRSKKYGTPPPRADVASLDAMNVLVLLTCAGCIIANHARQKGSSWISKAWRWARRQGADNEYGRDDMRTAAYRAATKRQSESSQVSGRSDFKFPTAPTASSQSSSRIDPSFTDIAVPRQSGTSKPKSSAKKKKKGKR